MDLAPASSPVPPRRPLWRAALVWALAALVYGAALAVAALWGLKAGDHGRAQRLLMCYVVGGPLGLVALAPVHRFLLPRRGWWRYPIACLLVGTATTLGIPFVAYLLEADFVGPFVPGIPLLARAMFLVMPYAMELFFFLTLSGRLALPQVLIPVALAAWWLAARRARD
jgi:hypothetical protein